MKNLEKISQGLKNIRKVLVLNLFFESLKFLVLSIVSFLFILVPVCYFFSCSLPVMWVVSGLFFAAFIFLFVIDVVIPFFHIIKLKNTARLIEKRFPHLNGDLISALQFEENPAGADQLNISKTLINEHIKATANVIPSKESINTNCVPHRQFGKYWVYLSALMISPILLFSDFYASALFNTYQKITAQEITLKEILIVNPGDKEISYGLDCTIQAVTFTMRKSTPYLHIKKGDSPWQTKVMSQDTPHRFSYMLKSVKEPVEYYVTLPDITSPAYIIKPIKLPLILKHTISFNYPAYTGWNQKQEERLQFADIKAIRGTAVSMKIVSNNIILNAHLKMARDNESIAFQTNNTNEAKTIFRVKNNDEYNISITDNNGQKNIPLKLFRIIAVEDKKPTIAILSPKQDIEMPREMEIQIHYEASDDIGIGKIELIYNISQTENKSVELPLSSTTTSYSQIYNWDLKALSLSPGDNITYKLKVSDIYPEPNGPNTAESSLHSIRFPSLVEMYKRRAEVFNEPQTELSKLHEEHKLLFDKFQSLSEKLKTSDNMSWNDKKTATEMIKNQQDLQSQLEQQSQSIMQSLNELQMSYDVVEKYSQIQKIMENLLSEEMKKTLQELQEMIENSDSFQNIRAEMEKLQLDMEEYNKNLDRTIELLKKLSAQNSLQQLLDTLKSAIEQQEDINKKLKDWQNNENETLDKNYLDKKINENEKISKHIENELNNLSKDKNIHEDDFNSSLEETKKLFEDQEILKKLAELKAQIAANQKNKACQSGKSLHANFSSMKQSLENLLNMMLQQKNLIKKITYIIHRSIRVTRDMKELVQSIEKFQGKNKAKNLEHAQRMYFIENELNRISAAGEELAKDTPIIAPSFYTPFRNISNNIKQFNEPLFKKGSQTSVPLLKSHLSELNYQASLWVSLLETIIRAQQQSGQGEGMPSNLEDFFKQLEGLAQQQQNINNKTGMIPNVTPSTQSLQQYMQQMANEQRMLAEALSKLAKQLQGQERVLGDMNNIAAQMEKAATSLENYQVDSELKMRQKQIHTRLLEAQRSLRKREKSEERESTSGDESQQAVSPDKIDKELIKRKLENIIRQGNSAYIPEDYIEMVKEYFRLLMESK